MIAVDIDALEPNPLQPRERWEENDLDSLAQSIKEHGVIQPLVVTHGSEAAPYQIITGERRWRAARKAGLSSVPALVRDITSAEALELALVENVQREDLNAIEEALAYRQLADEFGLTQDQIAQRVGRSRSAVTNTIRLLDAPEPVRAAVINEQITAGHARALLSIENPSAQQQVLERIIDQGLNVRQTEQLVKALGTAKQKQAPRSSRQQSADERAIQDHLQRILGTRVDLKRGRKGGSITIHFYSDEELSAILDRFGEE